MSLLHVPDGTLPLADFPRPMLDIEAICTEQAIPLSVTLDWPSDMPGWARYQAALACLYADVYLPADLIYILTETRGTDWVEIRSGGANALYWRNPFTSAIRVLGFRIRASDQVGPAIVETGSCETNVPLGQLISSNSYARAPGRGVIPHRVRGASAAGSSAMAKVRVQYSVRSDNPNNWAEPGNYPFSGPSGLDANGVAMDQVITVDPRTGLPLPQTSILGWWLVGGITLETPIDRYISVDNTTDPQSWGGAINPGELFRIRFHYAVPIDSLESSPHIIFAPVTVDLDLEAASAHP